MKIALVYDWVATFGGAEQVLLALSEMFPHAPLYTAYHNKRTTSWTKGIRIIAPWVGSLPFIAQRYYWFPFFTPLLFESFSFSQYDLVLSVTSSSAKSVITGTDTMHLCYILTPPRYLWNMADGYKVHLQRWLGKGLAGYIEKRIVPGLQQDDRIDAQRPDRYIAISKTVAERVKTYYKISDVPVVYPPVDVETYKPDSKVVRDSYYLTVCRFVEYKRLDLLVSACLNMNRRLILIGRGRDEQRLRKICNNSSLITIITRKLTDGELARYYQSCSAFLYAAEEDFGIAAVEAQACGTPVIAYDRGGITEIIQNGKTGILFPAQTSQAVCTALQQFEQRTWSSKECRRNALRFSKQRFMNQMTRLIKDSTISMI